MGIQSRRQRREKLLSYGVQKKLDPQVGDVWGFMGEADSGFHGIHRPFIGQSRGRCHLDVIADKIVEAGKCDVMVLGPALGADIPLLFDAVRGRLKDKGVEMSKDDLRVDVFALTKALGDKAKEFVRRDYSGIKDSPTPFELYENPDMVGGYDVVLDSYGVGVKSRYPHRIIVSESELLAKNGVAYVETILDTEYPSTPKGNKEEHVLRLCRKFWESERKDKSFEITDASEHVGHRRWFIVERKK